MIEIIRFIVTMFFNFIGFIILGLLFQQITKIKITILEWFAITMLVQVGSIAFGAQIGRAHV